MTTEAHEGTVRAWTPVRGERVRVHPVHALFLAGFHYGNVESVRGQTALVTVDRLDVHRTVTMRLDDLMQLPQESFAEMVARIKAASSS